jgi:hypothetical protein
MFASCSAVNSSTDGLTLIGESFSPSYAISSDVVYTVFFTKYALDLPAEIEAQKIYFLRRNDSVIKIYNTLAAAQSLTSPVNFATSASGISFGRGTLFGVYFPVKTYPPFICWEIGAPTISDIACCPPVPEVNTDCPNAGSIVYGGATRTLKNFGYVSPIRGTENNMIGALNSEPFTVSFPLFRTGDATTWNVAIGQHFIDYNPRHNLPGLWIDLLPDIPYSGYPDGVSLWYQASSTTFPTTTYTRATDYSTLTDEQNYPAMLAAGLAPDTLTVTFSGQLLPPPQIKVYLPDAYFEHKSTPIDLGLVEEVLTYDPNTLTYWSDLKDYGGIPGRLHFHIPNFYPSGSVHFRDSGVKYEYQSIGGGYLFSGGFFPNEMLNTGEFNFYKTLDCVSVVPLGGNIEATPLKLFTARDSYDGYPTGLALGTTWFDSRVISNTNSSWRSVYAAEGFYDNRVNAKIVIAYSKWASGKFLKSSDLGSGFVGGTGSGYLDHYRQSAYFIQSVHPGAYVSSLEV